MLSSLATLATAFGKPLFSRAARAVPLWGVTVHTTGTDPLGWSQTKTAADVLQKAVEYYSTTGGPHYVIGWDGTIAAIVADEDMRGAHAGIVAADQKDYYNNTWRPRVSPKGVALWESRWPGKNSPADLVPDGNLSHVNDYWIGVEHIPIRDGQEVYAEPAYPGADFTRAQLDASKKLIDDIGKRHAFPDGWKNTPRLVGHSDLNPIERDAVGAPLWDPPYGTGRAGFDMDFLRSGSGLLGGSGGDSTNILLACAATAFGIWLATKLA